MYLPPLFLNCQCNINECKEKGKVCWKSDEDQCLHIRIDGCMDYFVDNLKNLKKADCLMLSVYKEKIYTFIVEVKTRHYDLNEIKEKFENTLNLLNELLEDYKKQIIVVPIVYAESHIIQWKRYAFNIKLKYAGKKALIAFLKYCEPIQRALPQ